MKFIFWLVAGILFFFIWVRYIERHNIYFPIKDIGSTPETVGLAFEEIYLKTEDEKLIHGWLIPNEKADFTVIFCHGNGGNISHRLEKIMFFYRLGLSTLIFDYRGYGKSEGAPSEVGLYKDAEAVYDYLVEKRRISGDSIIVYGESLGAAVAIHLAANRKVSALITEDAFTSIKDMSKIVYPFIPTFFISSEFDSVSKIKDVGCPKFIMHSREDEIVPFSLGEKLFEAAKPPKKFLKTRGSHNTAFFESEGEIRRFLREEML